MCAGTGQGGTTANCSVGTGGGGTPGTCTTPTAVQIAAVVLPKLQNTAARVTGAMGTSQDGTGTIYVYDLGYGAAHAGQYYAVVSSMAIDDDGSMSANTSGHQNQTTWQDANGQQLNAKQVPWWVIDDGATKLPNFCYRNYPMDGFQLGAIIYPSSKATSGSAKMVYAVLGDTQGTEISDADANHIGEGSVGSADALGIPDNGNTGGVSNDVLYIFSTGAKNRITPANGYTGTNASLASDAAKAGPSWSCQMIQDLQ